MAMSSQAVQLVINRRRLSLRRPLCLVGNAVTGRLQTKDTRPRIPVYLSRVGAVCVWLDKILLKRNTCINIVYTLHTASILVKLKPRIF